MRTRWGHDDLVAVICASLFTSKVKRHFLRLLSLCDCREMLFLSFAQLFLFGCLFLDIAKSNFSTWMQVFSDFPLVCFPRARFLKRTFFSFKVLPFVSGRTTDRNLKSDKAMCHPDFSCLSFSLSVSYMGLRKPEHARVRSSLWKEKSELQSGCRQFWEPGGPRGHRPASCVGAYRRCLILAGGETVSHGGFHNHHQPWLVCFPSSLYPKGLPPHRNLNNEMEQRKEEPPSSPSDTVPGIGASALCAEEHPEHGERSRPRLIRNSVWAVWPFRQRQAWALVLMILQKPFPGLIFFFF